MNAHRFVVGADHPDVDTPTLRVDAHRHRHGPYSAAGAVVRAIVPTIDDAGLLQHHDIEILTVAPSLGAVLTNARPTLTSTASAEERTRFYPRARTRRVAHGLIDLLNEVVRRGGEPWTLVVDHVDGADATDAEWLTHLLRRADPLLTRRPDRTDRGADRRPHGGRVPLRRGRAGGTRRARRRRHSTAPPGSSRRTAPTGGGDRRTTPSGRAPAPRSTTPAPSTSRRRATTQPGSAPCRTTSRAAAIPAGGASRRCWSPSSTAC